MSTLRQLETFVTVAQEKKMSAAAKKLFVSQPTVSQIISELESEYNAVLFERIQKQLFITSAGKILLENALKIIALHNNLDKQMKRANHTRPLRIGATLTIGNTMISNYVRQLLDAYPDIDVSVYIDNTGIIENRMVYNELDIALVEGIIHKKELICEPVIEDYLQLICSTNHPLAKKENITIEDLQDESFILRERGSGTRAIFENIMLSNNIPYITKWECNSSGAIINAVDKNLGLGILSYRSILDYGKDKNIKSYSIKDTSMKRYFYLCHNKNQPVTSQMRDFISTIEQDQDYIK